MADTKKGKQSARVTRARKQAHPKWVYQAWPWQLVALVIAHVSRYAPEQHPRDVLAHIATQTLTTDDGVAYSVGIAHRDDGGLDVQITRDPNQYQTSVASAETVRIPLERFLTFKALV